MKRGLLLFILFACFTVYSATAACYLVRMRGSLYVIKVTRTLGDPIVINYNDTDQALELNAFVDELVNVKIYDSAKNIIYQSDIVNQKGKLTIINTADWVPGRYQIVLTNPENNTQSTGIIEIGS